MILIGNAATNTGTIAAANGSVGLAAGNQIVLQQAGSDPRLFVSGGTGDVTNSGNLQAAQAELTAAGGNVYALAGNNGGIIRATGTQSVGGHIWLTANGGNVVDSGTLEAANANGSGGGVTIRAANIAVSGQVSTSATSEGQSGGDVSIIAADSDTVSGSIAASGNGAGAGGAIETSGQTLSVSGASVNAGPGGHWLLDPYDLTVDGAAAASIDSALDAGTSVTLQTTATGASGPGIVNPSGAGDILVNSAIAWNTPATLTLQAYRNIDINAPIGLSGGTLALEAAKNIAVNANIQDSGTGALYLVAGWDGVTTSLSALTNASVYGNSGGSITIGGTTAFQNVAVGSAGGTTTAAGANITLAATTGTAQLG